MCIISLSYVKKEIVTKYLSEIYNIFLYSQAMQLLFEHCAYGQTINYNKICMIYRHTLFFLIFTSQSFNINIVRCYCFIINCPDYIYFQNILMAYNLICVVSLGCAINDLFYFFEKVVFFREILISSMGYCKLVCASNVISRD